VDGVDGDENGIDEGGLFGSDPLYPSSIDLIRVGIPSPWTSGRMRREKDMMEKEGKDCVTRDWA